MKLIRSFALRFYLPLVVSAFLLFVVIVSPKFVGFDPGVKLNAEVSVLGIAVPLPVWLEKVFLLKCLLVTASFASLIGALSTDFSKYFPKRLQMDVYFDEKGIERNLRMFSPIELTEAALAADWRRHIATYDKTVTSSMGELWQRNADEMPDISDFARDLVHARGETTFIVKRVGLLSYRIKESCGKLDYDWDVPKKSRRSFCTLFELRETVNNHLRPKVWQLLKSPSVILKPEFKQVFCIEAGGQHAPFDHIVVGLTKVVLLPFPHFTNTVYLWKLSDGSTVPMAYGVYIPEDDRDT